ncbi:MAG: TonB-dependent receptor plug domain-containing protein [Pseudomonadota bacterium]
MLGPLAALVPSRIAVGAPKAVIGIDVAALHPSALTRATHPRSLDPAASGLVTDSSANVERLQVHPAPAQPAPAPAQPAPAQPAPGQPAPAPEQPPAGEAPPPTTEAPAPEAPAPVENPPTVPPAGEAAPAEGEAAPAEGQGFDEAAAFDEPARGSGDPYFNPQEEEVVRVTIDRREKDPQDFSGTVEVFTEADLERKGVTSMRELTAVTPYVEVGASEGNIEIYMRGIGNNNNTEIGDPAAAVHIDGVYVPRPRGLGSMFFDVERVEISRGPQGTLRGRNATAGTMNIVSAAPKLGEWAASGSFQYGNYAQVLTKAMVNVPIGDRLALRFATFSERRDPFYENEGGDPTIRAAEDADTLAYRASLKWAPWDSISVTVRHDYTRERGTGWTGTNVTEALQNGILPEEIPDLRSVQYVGYQPSQSLDHWGVSATIGVEFGAVNAELLSSYRDLDYKQRTGTTNGVNYHGKGTGSLDRYNSAYWHTASESFVNELRFFAPDDSRFRWTLGGFHLFESQYVLLGEVTDNAWGWAGQEYNHPDIVSGAYAAFFDATIELSDVLRALGGVRVTHEYKRRNGIGFPFGYSCAENTPCMSNPPHRFGTPGFAFAGRGRTDYTSNGSEGSVDDFLNGIASFGERDTLDEFLQQEGARIGPMNEQHGSAKFTFVDFRVGAELDLSPDNLLYATFSTGHKSGGFNDTITVDGEQLAPEFGPEAVYATEVGTKNTFAGRKLLVNAAAFWYAYTDYQSSTVESFGELPPGGDPEDLPATSVRRNAGDARVLGLEGNVVARLPGGFTGTFGAMVLDARFLGFVVNDTRVDWDPKKQPKVDLKGKFLPRAPQLSLAYGIAQTIPTSIGYFDWSVSGQTKSKMYMTQFNGEGRDLQGNVNPLFSDVVPWTHRFDASVGYTRPEGDIRIEGFCSNITNMTYMTSLINVPGLNLRFYNPPRQFGVRLAMYL